MKATSPDPKKPGEDAPWRTSGVKGVVPPGRRFETEKKGLAWSASGVKGVTPPGKIEAGGGADGRWAIDRSSKAKRVALPKSKAAPEPKSKEPTDLKTWLDQLAEFIKAHAPEKEPLVYDAFNRLLIAYGWLGNPMFLVGLCGVAFLEVREATFGLPRWLAWVGLVSAVLSWGRGIGSASGMYFLEPLIFANVPAFLWLGWYGLHIARLARQASALAA